MKTKEYSLYVIFPRKKLGHIVVKMKAKPFLCNGRLGLLEPLQNRHGPEGYDFAGPAGLLKDELSQVL